MASRQGWPSWLPMLLWIARASLKEAVAAEWLPVARCKRPRSQRTLACPCRLPSCRLFSDAQKIIGKHFAHEGAGADGAFNISFGLELLEGVDDGAAREAILVGQITRCRQPHSGTQAAFEDLGA